MKDRMNRQPFELAHALSCDARRSVVQMAQSLCSFAPRSKNAKMVNYTKTDESREKLFAFKTSGTFNLDVSKYF